MNIDWLNNAPRELLGHWPTPLEPLAHLSNKLGGPRIWVKRDDCSGLATGGNKTRKLEYALAEARAQGLQQVLTFGAVQSNHARQTAAACARLGLQCHLLLSRRVPWPNPGYEVGGNRLMDELFGATVTVVDLDAVDAAYTALMEQLGGPDQVYVMPAGGSSATGALGYVRCATEIVEQAAAADVRFGALYHASASAGTQAGLLTGLQACEAQLPVVGINVFHPDPTTLHLGVSKLCQTLAARYQVSVPEDKIRIEHNYLGDGYGLPNSAQLDAIVQTARLEGLLFDPVYSGKALHALIDDIHRGRLRDMDDVLLIHTGGTAAWAVYDDAWTDGTRVAGSG